MADLEFDYWPLERLQQLTQCLRSHSDASNPLSLPSSTNTAFWKRAAKSCGLDDNDDEVAEEVRRLRSRTRSAKRAWRASVASYIQLATPRSPCHRLLHGP